MPVWIEVDPETGRGMGVGTGELNLAQFHASACALWSDPAFRGKSVLWDLSDATFSLSGDEIRRFASYVKSRGELCPPARVAFVVAGELEFGQVRMFEILREGDGVEVNVFREMNAAQSWLDELSAPVPERQKPTPQRLRIDG